MPVTDPSTPAIRVQRLCKTYQIGAARAEYDTLRESLARAARSAGQRVRRVFAGSDPDGEAETVHRALDDVSFDIKQGEVVGIIGRNGAGKSTLLKILSRITDPTSGRIDLYGRVGSLLEVGTGFHPELTGRENIFLNGAILGMSRREIHAKFDAIVAFAEIGRFLDTPVKRYSSGMHVRLGFSVAAHLELETLIVDEVLAVGDAAFQRKCLGKMTEVSRSGRTVLFVSHNMAAVKSLCHRAILLDSGKLTADGPVDQVVDAYMAVGSDMPLTGVIPHDAARIGTGEARFRRVKLVDSSGRPTAEVYFGQPLSISLMCEVTADVPDALFEVSVSAIDGTHVLFASTLDGGRQPMPLTKGEYVIDVEMDAVLLPRAYTIDVGVHRRDGRTIDFVQRSFDFSVMRVAASGHDHYPWSTGARGYVRPATCWQVHEQAGTLIQGGIR